MARILFIDDDPMTLETLSKAVEILGHQALQAHTAGEGLELARQQSPDLIFTDLRLPDMEGLALIGRLHDDPSTASIPVLVLSASPALDEIERAQAAGAQGYLHKPIRLQTLLDLIQKHCG
ncbi:MAG: response regulator [Anaerolineales bacterium]|nr:response regulator [Anaerolineales bacterium]MCS7248852.1 response regulator [Anaerolineales bacterium]MDW8162665.1 response regulator [Anaerolineales bacterium]MDW8445735.1 response regulator [Anaerolineales bacterium]